MFSLKTILQAPAAACSVKGLSGVLANKANQNNLDQSRSICHKSKLKAKRTFRWPYETIPWNYLTMWADPFTKRKFNENTKLITVDGNVAAGKEVVAKKLADELGMLYLPPNLDLDKYYINEHGFDYRALNPLLPERLRICDFEMFHENPTRHSVIHLQHHIFKLRVYQLFKALRHMFNTGQGVVLTRSCYTDRVFVEAMHNLGWLPTGYVRGDGVRFYDWKMRYNFLRNFVLSSIQKPHLVVYVDTPVDVCLERIQNDSDPATRNSKALTRQFLEEVESAYKDVILPKCEHNGFVHTISGAEPFTEDDCVDLIDEIESMNFELDPQDTRFSDWNDILGNYWHHNRRYYTSIRMLSSINTLATMPFFDIAGMGDSLTHADLTLRYSLYEQHVDDLGFMKRYDADSRIHGWLKTTFGFEPFEKRLDRSLRIDFA